MIQIEAEQTTREREVERVVVDTETEEVVTVTLSLGDARHLYNFAEYSTRRYMDWRSRVRTGAQLDTAQGRDQMRGIAAALSQIAGYGNWTDGDERR